MVDVRSIPRSRTNPQFNGDGLAEALAPWQVGYEHLGGLGGLRSRSPGSPSSPNGYWKVKSFRNYADYALTPAFGKELAQLEDLGRRFRCAIICAEAAWWRCHRRIIADYLLASGQTVLNILGPSHIDEARLTPGAVISSPAKIVYPGAEGAV
ncbi:DUF488 family protein [Phenylobacterium sp.]|uniref:DUF488 domain-containing protein n=1 Tax=Phenylobacterium sp. TaxID=1871053 RepID=UPI00356B3C2A